MKILLDENISQRLIGIVGDALNCTHVEVILERGASDSIIWEYAKTNDLMILSKDNDFRQRAFVFGPPPKVIWLDVGNARTSEIAALLLANLEPIQRFHTHAIEGLLVVRR
jgi:predicted nuclease of predicted toxin-antitoxin system